MKSIPKHFSLVKEHPQSYEIHDSRDGRRFHVAKSQMDLGMHAKLAKIQHFDEGGKASSSGGGLEDPRAGIDPGTPAAAAPSPLDQPGSGYYAEIGPAAGVLADAAGSALNSIADLAGPPALASPTQASSPVDPVSPPSSAPIQGTAPAGSGGAISASGPPGPMAAQSFDVNAALTTEREALLAGADAEEEAGTNTAQAYSELSNKLDSMLTPQQIQASHQKADQDLMKAYMDKSIDPEHYWNSRNTGQKIAAGLGLILGGLGSGITGQPNLALQIINGAIDRDMEAQRSNQSQSMNLWKMNREATQDDLQANLATQNQMLMCVKAKAMQYASTASGPAARARLAPVIAQIDQQAAMNNFHRSMLTAANQGGPIQSDPAMMLNMIPEKDRPEAAKEITAAKNLSTVRNQSLDVFNKLAQLNTIGNRMTSPLQTPREVAALRDNAATQLARDEAGRVNEFEFKAAQQTFPAAGDTMEGQKQKLQNLISIINRKKVPGTVFKSNTGIDLDRFASTTTTPDPLANLTSQQKNIAAWAKQNPQDPRASMALRKLGL